MASGGRQIVLCGEKEKTGVRDERHRKQHCMETQGKTSWPVGLKEPLCLDHHTGFPLRKGRGDLLPPVAGWKDKSPESGCVPVIQFPYPLVEFGKVMWRLEYFHLFPCGEAVGSLSESFFDDL